jgi:hypothetical protein
VKAVLSNLKARAQDYLDRIKGEVRQVGELWEKRKKERKWKRTKRHIKSAQEACHAIVYNQFYEEELRRRMSATICVGQLDLIAEERISLLASCGIRTAYDIYRFRGHGFSGEGPEALQGIFGIGPVLSQRLYDWSLTQVPAEVHVEPNPIEYRRRYRRRIREYLQVKYNDVRPEEITDRCPKCGKSLGAGVTRCWSSGCDYIVPRVEEAIPAEAEPTTIAEPIPLERSSTENPFQLGGCYENRKGFFTVISLDGDMMRIRWDSGEEITDTVAAQVRILRNMKRNTSDF